MTDIIARPTLYVFDIDDTLFRTSARVGVVNSAGDVIYKIPPAEFNDFVLPSDCSYDFSEFRCSAKFKKESVPIPSMIETLNRIHKKIKLSLTPGSKIILNTAREEFACRKQFMETFEDHLVDIEGAGVHCSGSIPGDHHPSDKKLMVIKQYIDSGEFGQVHMYDDNETNLKFFLTLRNEYPHIRFYGWRVGGEGEMVLFT